MQHIITAIDHITPAWLTETLHRNGHITSGAVLHVAVSGVFDEQDASISYFLALDYAPDTTPVLPQRLFLKLPRAGINLADIAASSAREIGMYERFAADQQLLPIIRCYDAAYDPDHHTYHLLLEDLSATHDQPSWHLSIADHYVSQTVDCLARFHGFWWEHPRLNNDLGQLPAQWQIDHEIAMLRNAFPGFATILGDRLNPTTRTTYEQMLTALPSFWLQRMALQGQTFLHGDAHFWNFLYPRDPATHQTVMLDWQLARIGRGTDDLAYTIVLRYPHRTAANEQALVRRYYDRLITHGVTGYSWEHCWADYRQSAAEQLLFPVRFFAHGLPEAFWGLFVPRTWSAFEDLKCNELL